MSSAVGKRYARAIFDVASERGKIDQVEADLGAIVQAVEQNAELSKIMQHPHIAADAKKSLVEELFKSSVGEESFNFLNVLIENGREVQLPVVDPAILGGIVIKIGDRLYDGSLKTKLETFAHQA
jgi:F-type H+-transporting ATPase subunit delta